MTPVSLIIDGSGSFNTDFHILQHHFCIPLAGTMAQSYFREWPFFILKMAVERCYQAGCSRLNFNKVSKTTI
jgi:hypothetical protein